MDHRRLRKPLAARMFAVQCPQELAVVPGIGNANVDISTPDRRRSRPPMDSPGSGGSGDQQPPAARLRSTIPDFRAAGFGVTEGDVNNFRMQIQAVIHNMQDHFSTEIAKSATRVDVLVRARLDDRMLNVENTEHWTTTARGTRRAWARSRRRLSA